MKNALLACVLLVTAKLSAQTWVQVPDQNFQQLLTNVLPAGSYMTSGTDFFIDSDHAFVQNLTELSIYNYGIASVEGVQAFENLEIFYCYMNQLTSLPPLPATLIDLDCSMNQLLSLPTLPSSLQMLSCHSNSLTSLPALPASLTDLNCSINQLTSLPVLPASLENLYCSENVLTSLPVLPATLQTLACGVNELTALPDLPEGLEGLVCDGNNLSALPNLPSTLINLICPGNQITALPVLPQNMESLNCAGNELTALPSLPSTLTILHCNTNQITCFEEFAPTIMYITLYSNPFTCLPNYLPAMEPAMMTYPLCDDNDPQNNPNGCPSASIINGVAFDDVNLDCVSTGSPATYIPINLYNISGFITSSATHANGNYYFGALPGDYFLQVATDNLTPALQVNCPMGNFSDVTVAPNTHLTPGGDFGLNCVGYDLGVQSVVATGMAFPGETHTLKVLAGDLTAQYGMYCAAGIAGEVMITVTGPGVATFAGSPTIAGNSAIYTVADFGELNVSEFLASIVTDTTAQAGDSFCITVTVSTAATGEMDTTNNTYTYCYPVSNSYDPNIKETYPEIVDPGYEDEFTYTIHFQNTGNAPAINIRLSDELDDLLDLSTLKIVGASAPYTYMVDAHTRLLSIRFPNIMLPDSASNPEGSIGYVQYRIKPLAGLEEGDTIHNTAGIYFDYNEPIITNTTHNTVFTSVGVNELVAAAIKLYPNPAREQVRIDAEQTIEQLAVRAFNGTLVLEMKPAANTALLDTSTLAPGVYIVTVKTGPAVITRKLIVQ